MTEPEAIEPLPGSPRTFPDQPVDPFAPVAPDPDPDGSDPFAGDGDDEADDESQVKPRRKDKPQRPLWIELPILIAVALVVAVVVKTFLVQAFFIPSASMMDTLVVNDRVMVNKLAYRWGEPSAGQVIVFDDPRAVKQPESFPQAVVRNIGEALGLATPDTALIKRVIALEGQTVQVSSGVLSIDGEAQNEPYVTRPGLMNDFGPVVVPEGHVFVMGDNRNQSEDSRSSRLCPSPAVSNGTQFCPVPVDSIIGRAFVRVWPPSRWGGL